MVQEWVLYPFLASSAHALVRNGNKIQMQRMDSVPILCINVNITIDTMLKIEANLDANANIDTQCEQTFTNSICEWTIIGVFLDIQWSFS